MKGAYQHCGDNDLPRYLTEVEFRYKRRTVLGCNGKDLTLRR
jgi:hypothetical protein